MGGETSKEVRIVGAPDVASDVAADDSLALKAFEEQRAKLLEQCVTTAPAAHGLSVLSETILPSSVASPFPPLYIPAIRYQRG